MSKFSLGKNRHFGSILTILLGCLYLAVVLKVAWVGDDAYIIFRSIEQVFAGNGPRWNAIERVQTYTSPLWFWLSCIPRIFSSDLYINAIALSLLCNAAMIRIVLKKTTRFGIPIVALLISSNAFMDYTSSGLEYPLIYLLIALFVFTYILSDPEKNYADLKRMSLIAGLMLVTRHDLLMLVILPMASAIYSHKTRLNFKQTIIILVFILGPLLAWSLYSLVYYGMPFPNTAYAKLGLDVPRWQYLEQGAVYFLNGAKTDIISIIILIVFTSSWLWIKDIKYRMTIASALLAEFYVIWVGADFMSGRFYSHIVLFGLLAFFAQQKKSYINFLTIKNSTKIVIISACALLLGAYHVFYSKTPLNTPLIFSNTNIQHGISDERGFYSGDTSVWKWLKNDKSYFPDTGQIAEAISWRNAGEPYYRLTAIGMTGYWLGTEGVIVDFVALSDAMRARMPRMATDWSPGHTTREIPIDYEDSLIEKKSLIEDPYISLYFTKFSLIIQSDDLFTWERFKAIYELNTGQLEEILHSSNWFRPNNKTNAWNSVCDHPWAHPQPVFILRKNGSN